MLKRHLFYIIFLIIVVLFKCFVWWLTVPIWQTPDEQAHFTQLEYFVENKTTKIQANNLSQEIYVSEELLGTNRDSSGNNKFTFHPEYKIPYTFTLTGKYENLINYLPIESRTVYVGKEAAEYPPAYYQLASPFYKFDYSAGIIDRVYNVRLLSIILNITMAVVAYMIGMVIWKKKLYAFTLAIIVSFQPMISFVSAGVHPDNLLNLIYSIGILISLLILRKGITVRYLILIAIIIYLGIQTKALMFLFIPLAGAVIAFRLFSNKLGYLVPVIILISPVLVFVFQIKLPYVPIVNSNSPLAGMGLAEYLHFRIPKMLFEVWPWYWGVFKWLGVTLPPLVMRIITRVAILAAIGCLLKLVGAIRSKNINFEIKSMLFFVIASFSYIAYLLLWDWRLMQTLGYSQGLQGRYFFPYVIAHLSLLVIGILGFIPESFFKVKNVALVCIIFSVISLNFISLYTVANTYYDTSSGKTFLIQLGQYKPKQVKYFINSVL